MSALLPLNVNNIEEMEAYNNLTEYEKDLSYQTHINKDDGSNYDLLMSMYENQYTNAIVQNDIATDNLMDTHNVLMLF